MLTATRRPTRVALFADTFYEANGVGTLSRHLTEFARRHELPMLIVRGGEYTELSQDGSLETLILKRGGVSFPVEKKVYFDPLLMRHKALVIAKIRQFQPDLIHVMGPGDIGLLGVRIAYNLQLRSVASWHTNLHEYLPRRLHRVLNLLPGRIQAQLSQTVQQQTLRLLMRFYRTARFTLAPNQTMVDLLKKTTGRPSYLMMHGVDLERYKTQNSNNKDEGSTCCIGYVGRLTTEKNVQVFVDIEQGLAAEMGDYRLLIVGEGGREKWLRDHLRKAEFAGVLRDGDLAAAYRRMDVLVFPSLTDTFGLVVLEAMASGVPVILTPEAGSRIGVEDGVSGLLTHDFVGGVRRLMRDPPARRAMGKAASAFAKTQGWDTVFCELYETYAHGLEIEGCAT